MFVDECVQASNGASKSVGQPNKSLNDDNFDSHFEETIFILFPFVVVVSFDVVFDVVVDVSCNDFRLVRRVVVGEN